MSRVILISVVGLVLVPVTADAQDHSRAHAEAMRRMRAQIALDAFKKGPMPDTVPGISQPTRADLEEFAARERQYRRWLRNHRALNAARIAATRRKKG